MAGNFAPFSLADQYSAATRDVAGQAKLGQLVQQVRSGQQLRQSLANLYQQNPQATDVEAANVALKQGAIDEYYKIALAGAQRRGKRSLRTMDKPLGGGEWQRYMVSGEEMKPWGKPYEKKGSQLPYVGTPTKTERENATTLLGKIMPEDHPARNLDPEQQDAFLGYVMDKARQIQKIKRGTKYADALKEAFAEFETKVTPEEKATLFGQEWLAPNWFDKPAEFDPTGQAGMPPLPPGATIVR